MLVYYVVHWLFDKLQNMCKPLILMMESLRKSFGKSRNRQMPQEWRNTWYIFWHLVSLLIIKTVHQQFNGYFLRASYMIIIDSMKMNTIKGSCRCYDFWSNSKKLFDKIRFGYNDFQWLHNKTNHRICNCMTSSMHLSPCLHDCLILKVNL